MHSLARKFGLDVDHRNEARANIVWADIGKLSAKNLK